MIVLIHQIFGYTQWYYLRVSLGMLQLKIAGMLTWCGDQLYPLLHWIILLFFLKHVLNVGLFYNTLMENHSPCLSFCHA